MKYVFYVLTFIVSFFLGMVFGGFAVFYSIETTYVATLPTPTPTLHYPTGYELFEALNVYRIENDLPPLVMWEPLCNNIGARAINYQQTNSHDGLSEFIRDYMPEGIRISEILVTASTAEEMVDKWSTSPSHDLMIKENSRVCTYTSGWAGVALLSN